MALQSDLNDNHSSPIDDNAECYNPATKAFALFTDTATTDPNVVLQRIDDAGYSDPVLRYHMFHLYNRAQALQKDFQALQKNHDLDSPVEFTFQVNVPSVERNLRFAYGPSEVDEIEAQHWELDGLAAPYQRSWSLQRAGFTPVPASDDTFESRQPNMENLKNPNAPATRTLDEGGTERPFMMSGKALDANLGYRIKQQGHETRIYDGPAKYAKAKQMQQELEESMMHDAPDSTTTGHISPTSAIPVHHSRLPPLNPDSFGPPLNAPKGPTLNWKARRAMERKRKREAEIHPIDETVADRVSNRALRHRNAAPLFDRRSRGDQDANKKNKHKASGNKANGNVGGWNTLYGSRQRGKKN